MSTKAPEMIKDTMKIYIQYFIYNNLIFRFDIEISH